MSAPPASSATWPRPTICAANPHPGRDFVFCDCCNPQGIRYIELRRGPSGTRPANSGRRVTDGRAWHEGDDESARRKGWFVSPTAHYCQQCAARHPELVSDVA